MSTYELITFNQKEIELLAITESNDITSAMQTLKAWAAANGHQVAKGPHDVEATCQVVQNIALIC